MEVQDHQRRSLAAQAESRTTAPRARAEGQETDHPVGTDGHGFEWAEGIRIAIVAISAALVWFRIWEPYRSISVIGIVGLLIGGWPILVEAWENIRERRMTMELSMTIAIAAAATIGQFFTALVITLFVLVAEVLEGLTVFRGRRAIRDLLEFLPREVPVRRTGSVQVVSADELKPGETILVNPGGRIPVDGKVAAGHSFVDESRITGESMPVEKIAGARVFAGSINQSGALEVVTELIGRDTSYGKIIDAVEHAERTRAPVQRLADRLAGYLVYFALGAAALTYIITRDLVSTISVIIVAGACGIAAGTPLAILGGIGRCARLGAIVKGGVHLETLGRIDTVVLDKTGTVTVGEPKVQQISACDGASSEEVLALAATAELRSEHPLAKAIIAHAREQGLPIAESDTFRYTPGKGIAAGHQGRAISVGNRSWMRTQGVALPTDCEKTLQPGAAAVFVARDKMLMGSISIADTIRPEASSAIARIKALGIRVVLLTGDSASVAGAVARQLGISEAVAEVLPEQKLERVRRLVVDESRTVAMVGDGINDAPALVEASVGVAMGSGTDVAQESADVVLLGNDLLRFAETLMTARQVRRTIWQNFTGTLAVDAAGIVLAAFGLLGPLLAAFIHVVSELAFILNSARLSRRGPTQLKSVRAEARAR
jgi:Cd2+/Zn2+-exporting ATPase/Cu+-exporting ATPase